MVILACIARTWSLPKGLAAPCRLMSANWLRAGLSRSTSPKSPFKGICNPRSLLSPLSTLLLKPTSPCIPASRMAGGRCSSTVRSRYRPPRPYLRSIATTAPIPSLPGCYRRRAVLCRPWPRCQLRVPTWPPPSCVWAATRRPGWSIITARSRAAEPPMSSEPPSVGGTTGC